MIGRFINRAWSLWTSYPGWVWVTNGLAVAGGAAVVVWAFRHAWAAP